MKTICLIFHIHHPYRLKKYRFSDIGNDHYYYDDFLNEDMIYQAAQKCYLPANRLLLDLICASGKKFKVAFAISGLTLEQLEIYAPEALDSFKELAATGNVEFLASTFSHSLSSLGNEEEFALQTRAHRHKLNTLFGVKPSIYCNTGLLYSDHIARMIERMGFEGVLADGGAHWLDWKSPDYLYKSEAAPSLKLLLRHPGLSDDIGLRFNDTDWNEYPLTASKYASWIARIPRQEQLINLYMDYETLGSVYPAETGIFDFFRALPEQAARQGIGFSTPSEIVRLLKPVGSLAAPAPLSAIAPYDTSCWLGNELQQEAFRQLSELGGKIITSPALRLMQDWYYLHSSDHFYAMGNRFVGRKGPGQADTPFAAFGNYMNVLADFAARIRAQLPTDTESDEQNPLLATIRRQEKEIDDLDKELRKIKKQA